MAKKGAQARTRNIAKPVIDKLDGINFLVFCGNINDDGCQAWIVHIANP